MIHKYSRDQNKVPITVPCYGANVFKNGTKTADLLAAPSLIAGWQFNISHLFNAQNTVQTRNGGYCLFECADTVLELGFKKKKKKKRL